MSINIAHMGLSIESPLVTPTSINYRPQKWPPQDDFPIVIDENNNIISRYIDSIWNFKVWAKKSVIIDFCDNIDNKSYITPENSKLLRKIVAWWLYGPNAVRTAITLRNKFYNIKPLFVLCSKYNISASQLHEHPAIIDELINDSKSNLNHKSLSDLHMLYEQRDELGFTILKRNELIRLSANISIPIERQTPYIPPRIWAYQVNQLKLFLDDFHKHREKIESCFKFCINAYEHNYVSISETYRIGRNSTWGPFWSHKDYNGNSSGRKYIGKFIETARDFGIADLLLRWVPNETLTANPNKLSIRSFSKYFIMVGYIGIAYILNFSLMRISECWSLKASCLVIENDEKFGPITILRACTSKTIDDTDARWPTSPSVKLAIDAMTSISRLRISCASANPNVPTSDEDINDPFLILRPYEPWGGCGADELQQSISIRPHPLSYLQVCNQEYPSIFRLDELRITESDLQLARLVTTDLDDKKFNAGMIWSLSWHQLRRTGSVNMQSSGLVSDASLQYLLKHSSRAMSQYYGKGYSHANLNVEARNLYINAMYEVLAKEISQLFSNRFISPHGEKRKEHILKIINPKDNEKLIELAKLGKISWRETILGGCTKREPCPYGGIDNLAHCGGGDGNPACADVLYDQNKVIQMKKLSQIIDIKINETPENSPYRKSLEAQSRAIENALNAIKSK